MKRYSVTFHPDNKTVIVEEGTSLLAAANEADVPINNMCGGESVCGKCRVIVKSGNVTAAPTMFLSRSEIQRGVALACQTAVDGDVVVEVPKESRVSEIPQLASEDAIRFGKVTALVGEGTEFPHDPLACKLYLDIPHPTGDDSLPDQERVLRTIRATCDVSSIQTGLNVLRRMPETLRENDWSVTALLGVRGSITELVDLESGNTAKDNLGVAIDVGTTTVVAHLVDLNTSQTLGAEAKYNGQIRFGDDVIARMMYANISEHRQQMTDLIVADINDLITGLALRNNRKLHDINIVVCAGNTTMTHFLFGLPADNIRRDPYVPAMSEPPTIRACEVGVKINPRGLLTAVPTVAGYVGGDVVADVLVTGMTASEELSLLIDMGTNGELVLGNSEWLLCCSASAGPAFEGGGIKCGMRATTGAIEGITLREGGNISDIKVVNDGKPQGICGSGLIDCVSELLRVGCIDRRGRFVKDACDSRLRLNATDEWAFLLFPGEETSSGDDIVLTESDINNLIHSKGSIYMAAECLLDHVGMSFKDLHRVYIAGGFGEYLRITEAINIGLLPDLNPDIFQFVGNGSVQGATMTMLSRKAMAYAQERIAGSMTYLELSTYHKYMNEYSSCLFLPHTDIERFPSVATIEMKRSA